LWHISLQVNQLFSLITIVSLIICIADDTNQFPVKTGTAKTGNVTLEDYRMVLYKTKSLDGTKPNTNFKTNPDTNSVLNPFGSHFRVWGHRS